MSHVAEKVATPSQDAAPGGAVNDYRENWKPYVPDFSDAQNTILEHVFHHALMLGRESVWAGLDYEEATALNPYTKERK